MARVRNSSRRETKPAGKLRRRQYLVPAIKRSVDIIDLLAHHEGGMTVSEIHRDLRLPLSSAAAILYTLETVGYIERHPETSRYNLGTKLFSFSRRLGDQLDLTGRCHSLLADLASETGLTSHIAVLRDGESVYVDRVPGSGLIQFSSYIGMSWPLHASGVGKAFLAFLPREESQRILKNLQLTKITSRTISQRSRLAKQLESFRREGFAWEIGEGDAGAACVAAPVFGRDGAVVAAVSVAGSVQQIGEENAPSLGAVAKRFAELMSARIGS